MARSTQRAGSSSTRNEASDAVLSSRLRSLGYSLAVPPPPPPPKLDPMQVFYAELAKKEKEWRREQRGYSESESSDGEEQDDEPAQPQPEPFDPRRRLPSNDEDLTLSDLNWLVEANKRDVLAAKEQKRMEKERAKEERAKSLGAKPKQPAPPVSSPSKKNGREKLSSSAKPNSPQVSPQKRRALSPSPPRRLLTPRPRTPSPTPSNSSSTSSLGSPSPSQRAAARQKERKKKKKHLVGLVPLAFHLAAAMSPHSAPLLATIQGLVDVIPDLTLPGLVELAQAAAANRHILETARSRNNRYLSSTGYNFVGDSLFSSSGTPKKQRPLATHRLANALFSPDPTSEPAAPSSSSRILSTRHTFCIQCHSPLVLRNRRPTTPFLLIESANAPAIPVVPVTHTCSSCGAFHAPDHVEISQGGRALWIWDEDAEAVKVGARVFLSRALIEYYRALLLDQATSPGGFAELWNGLYGEEKLEKGNDEEEEEEEDEWSDSEEEDEDDPLATPTKSNHYPPPKKRWKRPARPFRLRGRHLWRAFVLLSAFPFLSTPSSSAFPLPFSVTLARPTATQLVALVNRDLFGGDDGRRTSSKAAGEWEGPRATVLPHHACDECSRERRSWLGDDTTEEERQRGVRYAGVHARLESDIREHTVAEDGPPVSLAVLDGIQLGHPLCAFPSCPNPPEKHRRSHRFCTTHGHHHGLCGVFGCDVPCSRDLDEDNELTEACWKDEHQALWASFKRRQRDKQRAGWAGRRRGKKEEGLKYEVLEVDERAEEDLYEAGEGESGSDGEDEVVIPIKVTTMWTLRRTTQLQVLVASCGVPLAWTTLYNDESPSEVVSFLSFAHAQLSPDPHKLTFPTYIAYDRACHVLRFLLSASPNPILPPFLSHSRLILTAFHRRAHHADDAFCAEFCNPTPLEGEGRDNLVVPYLRERSKRQKKRDAEEGRVVLRTFERVFNTTAAEQLNSTLFRFAPLLSSLRADNFSLLVNVLLRHRRDRMEKGKKK